MSMTIGDAARLAGCSTPTIRFYESIGLIATAARTQGGRRTYGWPDVKRLQFIRRAREFGMSVDQVRELLTAPIDGQEACGRAGEAVRRRLDEVRAKQRELASLEASLETMAVNCDASCGMTGAAPCTIFEGIAQA